MSKQPWKELSSIDEAFHAPARIAIMIFLYTQNQARFSQIQDALNITPGNLSSHLKKLAKSGYVEIEKKFVDDKPTTILLITPAGLSAITRYIQILNKALN